MWFKSITVVNLSWWDYQLWANTKHSLTCQLRSHSSELACDSMHTEKYNHLMLCVPGPFPQLCLTLHPFCFLYPQCFSKSLCDVHCAIICSFLVFHVTSWHALSSLPYLITQCSIIISQESILWLNWVSIFVLSYNHAPLLQSI